MRLGLSALIMIYGDNRIEYRADLAALSLERGNENVTPATIVDLETNQRKLGVGQAGGSALLPLVT